MARLAGERLNDTREAIALWNQVLAIEARDEAALAGLATLYERERRWPALVEILDRQRQNAEGNTRRRAAAARAARHAALRADGRLRGGHRGLPADPDAPAEERARGARAARDLRPGGRLHGAGGALRRAGGVRRAVRSADLAGRSDGRHGRAHAPARAGRRALAGEAQSAGARAQGLRADPGDRSAQSQGGAGAGAALPGGAEVAAAAGDLRGAARPRGDGRRRQQRRSDGAVRRGAPHLRAATRLEVAGLPVVRARLRGRGQERRRPHRSRTPGRRGRRVGRAGGALRGAPGRRRPTPRSGSGCCAGCCASRRRASSSRRRPGARPS